MNDDYYFILTGIFLGYSKESINAFLTRRHLIHAGKTDNLPSSIGTLFEGTGLIPSERELNMSFEDVVLEINSRRVCSLPFPTEGDWQDEFDAFVKQEPSNEIRRRWLEYQCYLVDNCDHIREAIDESHLRTNPERRERHPVQTGRYH